MFNRINSDLMTVKENPSSKHWNRDDGYDPNIDDDQLYPVRVYGRTTFSINLDYVIRNLFEKDTQGFRILLHSSDELPAINHNTLFLPFGKHFSISVKPNIIKTSEGLRNYSHEERRCYFRYERWLQLFKSYSKNMCEYECLSNYTKIKCECVKFPMPGISSKIDSKSLTTN